MSLSVSATERGTFRRCRRQWWYSSANGLSLGAIAPQRNLSLGKVIHEALAAWLVEPDADLPTLFSRAADADLAQIRANYLKKVGAPIGEGELTEYRESLFLGLGMMENYQTKYGTPLFKGFTIIQPEVKVDVPVPQSPHTLSCRFDGIIREDRTGHLYILEHKTYGSRPKMETLQMNDQFLCYIWAAQQLGIGPVVGIAYDGMWKRKTPPRGSVLDDLFVRLLLTRPQYEIDEFPKYLAQEIGNMATVKEMATIYPHDIYPNRQWVGCFDCSFEKLCTAQSRGEDFLHLMHTQYVRLDADKAVVEEE